MRIALCVRYQKIIYRLVWLSESTKGIYIGVLGSQQDSHVSYHQDGTRHVKIGDEYHDRFSDTPISEHKEFKQLDHFSLSLTKNWFNSKTEYRGDEKTESIVLIDERTLYLKDTLALDVWLTDRASELMLLDVVASSHGSMEKFQVVTELVSNLDYFPNHKIALTLRSARVREVDDKLLMQQYERSER